ncbi:hypothetical protein [Streptomyces sp. NPDC005969]|uniref:hypothetical protein n=1 Tax=Streptomyces sp. NPDC005969 TaxID=3156722 RepID=UPI0033C62E81
MSVYTPQQISQPQTQQPYNQQQLFGQPPITQPQYGQQQPWGQIGQQQIAQVVQQSIQQACQQASQQVSQRLQQTLQQIQQVQQQLQQQGLAHQAHPYLAVALHHTLLQGVRSAVEQSVQQALPIAILTLVQQSQQGQQPSGGGYGQQQFGQFPGMQPQGQLGQFPGQGMFGQQPQYGQLSPMGM